MGPDACTYVLFGQPVYDDVEDQFVVSMVRRFGNLFFTGGNKLYQGRVSMKRKFECWPFVSVPFSVLTIWYSCDCLWLQAQFHSYFFVLTVSHGLLSTDERFSSGRTEGFPHFWLHTCSWEKYVILLQYGYIRVWGSGSVGFCTFTQLLHSFIASLRLCAPVFTHFSPTLFLYHKTRNSFLFLDAPRRGHWESKWLGLRSILCNFSKHGYSMWRVASFSVESFSELRSSFRYLSFYIH